MRLFPFVLRRLGAVALALSLTSLWTLPGHAAEAIDPAMLYQQRCAACHDQPTDRTPRVDALRAMSPDTIAAALTTGAMKPMAAGLDEAQIRALAVHLGSRAVAAPATAGVLQNASCKAALPPLVLKPGDWNGWGRDLDNSRFHPEPGLKASEVPRLKVKWVHEYPGRSAYGQPTVAGGRVFVGSSTGRVSALDAATGCEAWSYEAGPGVRSAIVVGAPGGDGPRHVAYFGDEKAWAHAVDAETGRLLWKTQLDTHALARVMGAPRFFEGRIYMPVSGVEIAAAGRDANYPCCTFRGSVVALDARTGRRVWQTYSIEQAPAPFRKNSAGTQMFGPAGGAIWSSPTIDAKRRLLYVGTGNSYTDVAEEGSDSIQAWDLDTGRRVWSRQMLAKDAYLVGCHRGNLGVGNCPQVIGPDADFGSPPLLRTLPGGRQVLIASQKSGTVHGLDPDERGKTLWQVQVGTGSALGGVHHGPAADAVHAYVAVSDTAARVDPKPGLTALRIDTGERLWHVPAPEAKCSWTEGRCLRAQGAAVTAIPGIVFSGAYDGHIRAYAADTGAIVWDHDTGVSFTTTRGSTASGGSIDFAGTTIADGIVYVNSGYGAWGRIGHLLIAYSVDGR